MRNNMSNDLKFDIRKYDGYDDRDEPRVWGHVNHPEFTKDNQKALTQAIAAAGNIQNILEIGVCRNGSESSTHILINSLPEIGQYLGVDIEDKSFLRKDRIHTIQTTSSNFIAVQDLLKSKNMLPLDFVFIDGWHSINQVLDDWKYTQLLRPGGVVALHDTTRHPGPLEIMKAIDPEYWIIIDNLCPQDHGFSYAIKK